MKRSLLKSTVWATWLASWCLAVDAVAADMPVVGEPPAAEVSAPIFSFESGLRYWYSTGTSSKDLYNGDGSLLFSRLTYDELDAHSGEIFFNATHNPTGIFVKGLLGAGSINKGSLFDEDFFYPPDTDPYSNTLSEQDGGDITYFTADLGYNVWNTPRYRVGAFVGYSFWSEGYDASVVLSRRPIRGFAYRTFHPTSASSARTTTGIHCGLVWLGKCSSANGSVFPVTRRFCSHGSRARTGITCVRILIRFPKTATATVSNSRRC